MVREESLSFWVLEGGSLMEEDGAGLLVVLVLVSEGEVVWGLATSVGKGEVAAVVDVGVGVVVDVVDAVVVGMVGRGGEEEVAMALLATVVGAAGARNRLTASAAASLGAMPSETSCCHNSLKAACCDIL